MVKILIADDHAVVRHGVREILAKSSHTLIGEASNSHELLERVQEQDWDLVILDITMPGKGGLDTLRELRQIRRNLPVLIFTMHPEDQLAVRVLQAGAAGYLTKESAPTELIGAVKKVLAGGKFVSASLAEVLAARLHGSGERPPHEALSDREYQILCMIALGKSLTEIAHELCLSVKTVGTYRARILEKMHMTRKAELVRYCLAHGLVQ